MKYWLRAIFTLTAAGLCFSGYLSAVKLFTGSCAVNESCPYFLEYPACWYGFAMYLIMFVATGCAVFGKAKMSTVLSTDVLVSAIGIVFAGNFVIQEMTRSRLTGTLGLSTCVYGLIFYVSIFITSLIARKKIRSNKIVGARHL